MTTYNGTKTGRSRLYVELIHIMKHIQQDLAYFNYFCLSEIIRPFAIVHVSLYCYNRSD